MIFILQPVVLVHTFMQFLEYDLYKHLVETFLHMTFPRKQCRIYDIFVVFIFLTIIHLNFLEIFYLIEIKQQFMKYFCACFALAFGKANACAWACLLGHLERRMHAHGHVCLGIWKGECMRMGMFAWAFGKANACAWACLLGHL